MNARLLPLLALAAALTACGGGAEPDCYTLLPAPTIGAGQVQTPRVPMPPVGDDGGDGIPSCEALARR